MKCCPGRDPRNEIITSKDLSIDPKKFSRIYLEPLEMSNSVMETKIGAICTGLLQFNPKISLHHVSHYLPEPVLEPC
jgi:hypothetical protein